MTTQNQTPAVKQPTSIIADPKGAREEIVKQLEQMNAAKFITLPPDFKESVFFALEKITTLDDIEKVLGYVKKYQAGSKEKNKIVNDMKHALDTIQSKFKINSGGWSKRGFFFRFSEGSDD